MYANITYNCWEGSFLRSLSLEFTILQLGIIPSFFSYLRIRTKVYISGQPSGKSSSGSGQRKGFKPPSALLKQTKQSPWYITYSEELYIVIIITS